MHMWEDLFVAICWGLWVSFSGCNRRAPTKLTSNLQLCQGEENQGISCTHIRIKSIFSNCRLATISVFLLLINFHTSKKSDFCSLLMVYACLCLMLFECTLKYKENSVSFSCWTSSSSNVFSLTKFQLKIWTIQHKKKKNQSQQHLVVVARIKRYTKNIAMNLFPLIEYVLFY